MKLGIATRLFLAFAGIAALSLASGGVGWWILNDVETAQTTIVERAMPAVADARLAAEIAGRIVARSPRLTNAATETVRGTEAAALFQLAERLQQALDRNVEYGYSDTQLETLRVAAERLRDNLSAQNELVATRIDVTGRLTDTIAQSLEAALGLSDLSETLVSNAAAGTTAVISNLYELVESQDRIEESLDALDRLYEEDVFLMERMQAASVRSSPQRWHASTVSTLTLSRVRVLAQRASLYEGPLPLAPGWVRAVSERRGGLSWRCSWACAFP